MDNLYEQSFQEWLDSGIAVDLIEENLIALEGQEAVDRLLVSEDLKRTNTGRVEAKVLNAANHLWDGGWYPRSYDMTTKQEMDWIQFKPVKPRTYTQYHDKKEGEGIRPPSVKTVKYESSPSMEARIYLAYIPEERAKRIVESAGLKWTGKTPFWDLVQKHPKRFPITVTEGSKKALALLSEDVIAIGLPGIWMGARKISPESKIRKLIPDLKRFTKKGRVFSIAFDSDKKRSTQKAVKAATFSLAQVLTYEKAKVNVLRWDSRLGKGIDDVLVRHGKKALDEIFKKSKSFYNWATERHMHLSNVDVKINSRYIADSIPDVPDYKLVAIKSPQNTGKTEWIANHIKEIVRTETPCFTWVHLESLARGLGKRFGLAYRTEKTIEKHYNGFTLCVDSLLDKKTNGVNPDDWDDFVIVIDEVEQVVEHLLCGETAIADVRSTVLDTAQEMLKKAKQVIIADADLTDTAVTLISELMEAKPYVIENTYQFDGMRFKQYKKQGEVLWHAKEELKKGNNIFVATTGQKASSKTGTIALEAYFKKILEGTDRKILRIDSETLNDPKNEAYQCLEHINEVVKDYDVVIASPSLCTGVSIDVYGHFSQVYGFSNGNIAPNSFLQMMWRLRDRVDRHYYSRPTAMTYMGNSSCDPQSLLADSEEISSFVLSKVKDPSHPNSQWKVDDVSRSYLETWGKVAARTNASSRSFDEVLSGLIKKQGHLLIEKDDHTPLDEITKEEIQSNAKTCQDKGHMAILNAQDISEYDLEAIEKKSRKSGRTEEENAQVKKYHTKKKYSTEQLTKELLEFDDEGKYSQMRLLYYVGLGNMFLEKKDLQTIKKQGKGNDNKVLSFDIQKKTYTSKVTLYQSLGVLDFIRELIKLDVITNDHPLIVQMCDHLCRHKVSLKKIGVFVGVLPIAMINSLLKPIGFKLKSQGVKTKNGDSVREYSIEKPGDLATEILWNWFYDDYSRIPESEQDTEITDFHINIYKEILNN